MQRVFIFFIVSVLCGCSATNVSFRVMAPSEISVPSHVRTVLLVNRTEPQNKVMNVIEGVLTGELPGQDRYNSEIALNGTQTCISNGPRLKSDRLNKVLKGSGHGIQFPQPLNWDTITSYCRRFNCEAMIALETYDGDFLITNAWKDVEKTENGKKVIRREYYAEGVAKVNLGFRLYDTLHRVIGLEERFLYDRKWNAVATTKAGALARLINRREALEQLSYSAGYNFGVKITPQWVTVARKYYKKAKKDPMIVRGANQAKMNDWDSAISSWKQALSNSNIKVKGRAAYNIAIAYEVKGDLPSAMTWAKSAFIDFNFKPASAYTSQLNHRMAQEQRLNKQLE